MKLRLCKCGRYYTHFSFCMKCFIECVDKLNEDKILLKPRLHSRRQVNNKK